MSAAKNWADLINGLGILKQGQYGDDPLHCEHDVLTVMSDPAKFDEGTIEHLDRLGFLPDHENGTFYSRRFGSA